MCSSTQVRAVTREQGRACRTIASRVRGGCDQCCVHLVAVRTQAFFSSRYCPSSPPPVQLLAGQTDAEACARWDDPHAG